MSKTILIIAENTDASALAAAFPGSRVVTPDTAGDSPTQRFASAMVGFEAACQPSLPDWVILAGEGDGIAASAVAAKKLLLPLARLGAAVPVDPITVNGPVADVLADITAASPAELARLIEKQA